MNGFESGGAGPEANGNGPIHIPAKRLTSGSASFENASNERTIRPVIAGDSLPGIVWPSPGTTSGYEFDSYSNHNSSVSSCCMSNNNTHPTTGPSPGYYYGSPVSSESPGRPCKPAPTKFWSNSSYDPVPGPTGTSSDPFVAAAVCHGSAFAAAAAHHAHANHVAAAAWCNYSPYHQTSRSDPYLTDPDHRPSFVDSYHTSMRPFANDQSCSGASSGYHPANSNTNQQPTTSTTGECLLQSLDFPFLFVSLQLRRSNDRRTNRIISNIKIKITFLMGFNYKKYNL